ASAGIGLERRIEPRQNAAPTLGRDPHDCIGGNAELCHQRAVEPDRQARAVAELVGEMIDAGMDVRAPAVAVRVVMRAIVHLSQSCRVGKGVGTASDANERLSYAMPTISINAPRAIAGGHGVR